MDGRRFDALVKEIAARSATRRGALAALGGGIAAGFGAWFGRSLPEAEAQQAPTPAPTPPAAGSSGAKQCGSDADCGGPPWQCIGTRLGFFCFNTSSDATYCGSSHLNCSDYGAECCKSVCTPVKTDGKNCGACGHACPNNMDCCAGACVDLRSDPKNCFHCGEACKPNELCCGGACADLASDPEHCGSCSNSCFSGTPVAGDVSSSCCAGVCVDLLNDQDNCGKCGERCPPNEICVNGHCVKETGAAGPPPKVDLAAAAAQTTDPALKGRWEVVRSEYATDAAALTSVSPTLAQALSQAAGAAAVAAVTIGDVTDQCAAGTAAALAGVRAEVASQLKAGCFAGLVKTVLVAFDTEAHAQAAVAAYEAAIQHRLRRDAEIEAEFADAQYAVFGYADNEDDPDFVDAFPGRSVIEFSCQEGVVLGLQYSYVKDKATAAAVGKGLIGRLSSGKTDGYDLAGRLAYAYDAGSVLDLFYSRLRRTSQRRFGDTDAQFAAQQATDGAATDFARATQVIPTTEPGTNYRLTTWAGEFAGNDLAQSWLDGLGQRLAAQSPDAQLTAIDEAKGLGDASSGVLYTLQLGNGVAIGVDLYVRVGKRVLAAGVSGSAPQMTPGLSALFADTPPLGAAAQRIITAQLNQLAKQVDANAIGPQSMPLAAIFAGVPLQPVAAKIAASATGTTKPASAAANPTPVAPDLPYVAPFPGRDVSTDYQLAGGTFCAGADICARVKALAEPYAGWVPKHSSFLYYNQTLQIPPPSGSQQIQSVIATNEFWFDTAAHAKQAMANWRKGFGSAQPIGTPAKGWSAFGYAGTQNGAAFDAVTGLMVSGNFFVWVQQTNYGATVDRGIWDKLLSNVSGYLKDVLAGKAPNLGMFAVNPFADANTADAYFGSYFVAGGAYARSAGQTDAEAAAQAARNKNVAYGYLGGFISRSGTTASTTARTFTSAADELDFYNLATDPERKAAIKAGFRNMPFDPVVIPESGLTANAFYGVDKNGVPGVALVIDDPAGKRVIVLSLDDGVVKVLVGSTVTSQYTSAVHDGLDRWLAEIAAILHSERRKIATKPGPPPPQSLFNELETLDDACKNDLKHCAM